jgi:hypothetical protein
VRVDGYADPRGTVDTNLKLSEERANAVRDLFLAAGVTGEALEVNAYGKSQSVAEDADGYALERRVRLTLQGTGTSTGCRGQLGPTAARYGADEPKRVSFGRRHPRECRRSCFRRRPCLR